MPEKLFLTSVEWLPSYGTTCQLLKARTQRGASREVDKMIEGNTGPSIPEGYTVMTSAQLYAMKLAIEKALGLYAVTSWQVEDVMEKKKMSRAKAQAWLEENEKHVTDASVRGGWDAIDCL